MYMRQYFECSDFASDDIVCGQTTTDPLFYSFSLGHTATQPNMRYYWYVSYKIINDVNTVIEAAEKVSSPDDKTRQLLGECYFVRAFTNFNLVKFFKIDNLNGRVLFSIISTDTILMFTKSLF